jgi:hypothetical protein
VFLISFLELDISFLFLTIKLSVIQISNNFLKSSTIPTGQKVRNVDYINYS